MAKAKQAKQTLCPTDETACPIADSASFEHAAVHHFRSPLDEYSGIMAGDGGYECLDVRSSLESCGGCASTGEGQDCSRIPHVGGVGCEAVSCRNGYKPNIAGTACIREGRRRKHHHGSH
ncbi:hypothetical protein OIV83_003647 [Microbotryomycetes sp. JL201]|nr:hypothetical protein OIV83_003647 [Microbotryomycetes sp. JL201]